MASIGDGWEDGAWVFESWIDGAWFRGVPLLKVASKTAISIGIGIYGLALIMGRALLTIGEWW